MIDSLFTVELPLANTDEELEQIKAPHKDCDSYFIASGCIKERREKFNDLWSQYKSLADRHFLSGIKKSFHERTWEMYLGCVIKKYFPNVSSGNRGPDFVLNRGRTDEIFIEAVACEKGITADAVPEMFIAEKLQDIIVQDVPHDKMQLRICSSLIHKYKKYKDFINNNKKPYIIAVNRGALKYRDDGFFIFHCLFAFEDKTVKIENHHFRPGGIIKDFFVKDKGVSIPMKFFEEDDHNIVSAVIYSPTDILNSPQNIGSDCILIHNPKAKFPIDAKIFSFLQQWKAEDTLYGLEIKEIEL